MSHLDAVSDKIYQSCNCISIFILDKKRGSVGEYQIPDKIKYRFITPKNVDRTYNRNAFNHHFNQLLEQAITKDKQDGELHSFVMNKLNQKFKKVEENKKIIEKHKELELAKQR